ncbi:MAG: sulfite exporter TauE/SafE family protein [Pseudolabrys sp.]
MDSSLLLIIAIFVLAGFVKGVVGLGLPTVSIALLSVIMMPAQAAALLIVPSFVTNVWQAFGRRALILLRRLGVMLSTMVVGTLLGGWWLPIDNYGRASMALGVMLILYALVGLLLPRFSISRRQEFWLSAPIGFITGIVTAMTGVLVIPVVPYLQALDLDRDDLVQALGITFTVSTVALAAVLIGQHQLSAGMAGSSLAALVAAVVGMVAGQEVRKRIDPAQFRIWFFIALLALGAHLLLHGLL